MHFSNKVPSLLNPSSICHFSVISTFSLHLSCLFSAVLSLSFYTESYDNFQISAILCPN